MPTNKEKETPFFSVVIPVYNGSNYLQGAIESVLQQSFSDFEVVVINDGSNDQNKTENICLSFGSRINYFRKENGGVASALNEGLKRSKGKYFIWLSHDDLLTPDRLEKDHHFISTHDDVDVIGTNFKSIDAENNIVNTFTYPPHLSLISKCRQVFELNMLFFCALTIKKTCFAKVGNFNEANRYSQDVEMALLLVKNFSVFIASHFGVLARDHEQRDSYKPGVTESSHAFLTRFIHERLDLEDFARVNESLSKRHAYLSQLYYGFSDLVSARKQFELSLAMQSPDDKYWMIASAFNERPLMFNLLSSFYYKIMLFLLKLQVKLSLKKSKS